jgi:hypothetical protein
MVVPSHDTRCGGVLPFRSFRRCILLTSPHRPYECTPTSLSSRILSHSLIFSHAFYSYLLSPHHIHTPNLERKLAKHPVSLAASPLQGQWMSNHDIPYFNSPSKSVLSPPFPSFSRHASSLSSSQCLQMIQRVGWYHRAHCFLDTFAWREVSLVSSGSLIVEPVLILVLTGYKPMIYSSIMPVMGRICVTI